MSTDSWSPRSKPRPSSCKAPLTLGNCTRQTLQLWPLWRTFFEHLGGLSTVWKQGVESNFLNLSSFILCSFFSYYLDPCWSILGWYDMAMDGLRRSNFAPHCWAASKKTQPLATARRSIVVSTTARAGGTSAGEASETWIGSCQSCQKRWRGLEFEATERLFFPFQFGSGMGKKDGENML